MTKHLQKTGLQLFMDLFLEIEYIHKPIEPFFTERLAQAHYTLTTEIFNIIATNTQKQAAKQLIVLRKEIVKLRHSMGVNLVIRFDPEWVGFDPSKRINEPDVFRLKLVNLVMNDLDRLVDFIIEYKPIPKVPKKI